MKTVRISTLFLVEGHDTFDATEVVNQSPKDLVRSMKKFLGFARAPGFDAAIFPSLFDPSLSEDLFGPQSYIGSCLKIAEFSGGNLSIDRFDELFRSDTAYIALPSWGRTRADCNEFFVIYPLAAMVTSPKAYEALHTEVQVRLLSKGVNARQAGLSKESKHCDAVFQLPRLPREAVDSAMFVRNLSDAAFSRFALRPAERQMAVLDEVNPIQASGSGIS